MAQRLARGAHNSEVRCSNHLAGIHHSCGLSELHPAVITAPHFHRLSSSEERSAHNREVTGSTPVGGIHHSCSLSELHPAVITAPHFHRRGAEAARRAHNPEVTGSKPVAGIFQFAGLQESAPLSSQHIYPGMAQRQRAGLITLRSLDRNGLPG